MYGTGYLATLKEGSVDAFLDVERRWLTERAPKVDGYVSSRYVIGDDGRSVMGIGLFESADAYRRLGEDPEQSRFWDQHFAPLFEGDVTWVDGTVYDWQAGSA